MKPFQASSPEIEVNGHTVYAVVAGLRIFGDTPKQILDHHGLHDPQPGQWYSQQAWLDVLYEVAQKIGTKGLRYIGQSIPDNADFPSGLYNIEKVLSGIDIAYHMNHRDTKGVLWDEETHSMREGIGHYNFGITEPGQGIFRCNNPYPCDFDQGIIQSMANRYKPVDTVRVHLDHGEHRPCRRRGDEACEYLISW